ncbi:MAG: succinate dehydrogenase assembly factor 2 [Rhodospirillales bacterium]
MTSLQHANGLSAVELRRLRWQCRRGLLELDLALDRFLERHGAGLEREDVPALTALLDLGDNELWDVVSGRVPCGHSPLERAVAQNAGKLDSALTPPAAAFSPSDTHKRSTSWKRTGRQF